MLIGFAIAAGLGVGAAAALAIAIWTLKSEIAFLREHVRFGGTPTAPAQISAVRSERSSLQPSV